MNYWKKRATQQLLKTEKKSEKVIDELVNLYDRSFSDIEQRIRHIFETYTNDGQMTKLEALKYLNEMETAEYYDGIRKKIPKAESEEEKQQLLNIYNSRAYGYRISRLMALENEMYMTIIRCKGIEEKLTRRHYEEIIIDRYQELIKDNVFTATTKYELEQMLDEKWLGSNFSDRIWKDQKKLTEELNKVLKVGLFTGKSNVSIAEEIKERMNVSLFNATRLVRTESNYYHNQIDLRAYKDMGIEKYRYLAVLDNRTSDICQELDGEVFEVSKAEVGVNFPPMHPFCRSTTIRADVKIKERRAKNPITGEREIVGNISYKDWYNKKVKKYGKEEADISYKKVKYQTPDRRQYEKYKNILKNSEYMPKTFEDFVNFKYNSANQWEKLKDDYQWSKHRLKAINNGELTPLSDINHYLKIKDEAHKKLIGIKLANNLEVKTISYHFIDRVIGCIEQRRSGVKIDDIADSLNGNYDVKEIDKSIKIYGLNNIVTINKETGHLIQVNPHTRRKK